MKNSLILVCAMLLIVFAAPVEARPGGPGFSKPKATIGSACRGRASKCANASSCRANGHSGKECKRLQRRGGFAIPKPDGYNPRRAKREVLQVPFIPLKPGEVRVSYCPAYSVCQSSPEDAVVQVPEMKGWPDRLRAESDPLRAE